MAHGLDVIFCGINPAATVVAEGHNASSRSNRFWPVLGRSVERRPLWTTDAR
jgi:double-stranded uracil-DNA glycosylase